MEPTDRAGFDWEVYFWAREADIGEAADRALAEAVMPWLDTYWPFERAAYPGRSIAWDDWVKLPLKDGQTAA